MTTGCQQAKLFKRVFKKINGQLPNPFMYFMPVYRRVIAKYKRRLLFKGVRSLIQKYIMANFPFYQFKVRVFNKLVIMQGICLYWCNAVALRADNINRVFYACKLVFISKSLSPCRADGEKCPYPSIF